MCNVILYWFSLTVVARVVWTQNSLVVETSTGSVKGYHIKSYEGRIVTAFEGIPYAKPPVDDLRFKEPEPAEPWKDILEVKRTYICMQYTALVTTKMVIGDEDCLYLYIYVPREIVNKNENLPVVVHLHGGGFIFGDPKSFAAPDYLMDRDIVYVNLNYRLGILGFLSTQDEVVSGNNGLKDQTLALKWIKENIRHFGGNPNSITLTGASAGAASVHLHYFSPLSKELFHRGCSQSGTALNFWSLTKNPLRNAKKLAVQFNCSTTSSKEMIDCLRKKPVRDVVGALGDLYLFINFVPADLFAPVIEDNRPGAFLPDHPYKLLLEGRINDRPWIASNTKDEGVLAVGTVLLHGKLEELDRRWDELLPYAIGCNDTALELDKTPIAKIIRNRYLQGKPLSYNNINQLIQLFTDRGFLVDGIKAANLQAKVSRSPIYYYLFSYLTHLPSIGNITAVAHGDDFKLLYRYYENPEILSESDGKMKDIFIDFLYQYAFTGVPSFKGMQWKPVHSTKDPISYMHILSPDTIRRENSLDLNSFAFWHSLPLLENEHLFN